MQFGGIPMVPSPSYTSVTSAAPLLSISAPISIEQGASTTASSQESDNNSSAVTTTKVTEKDSSETPMFSPHANASTHHSDSMFQTNANGPMSNGSTSNGTHYVNVSQQQSSQQQQQQSLLVQQQQQTQQAQAQAQQQQMNNGSSSTSSNGNNGAQLIYPALHLQPLNDTFAPKQISLSPPGPQHKVKIGRQTNQKTIPQPSNGYFDSKVLSRMHAEIWSQDGKVFIKDVKSSNGTFINGSRLSPEGQESDSFELHTDDIVEFGIDIVGEDNKTIIHHKVACRAFLVMTAEEALGLRHDFAALYRGGIAGSTLNHHAVGPGAEGGLRRSNKSGGSGGGGYGSTGTLMSFDHILHKLQAELQKSRDTAGELGSLNTAMHDIGETLGGGLPPMQNPPYQHMVPSLNGDRDGQQVAADQNAAEAARASSEALVKALEEQVRETQRSLNAHMERLNGVEARLEEHDGVKMDVNVMRSQVEESRRELAEALRMRSIAARGLSNGRDNTEEGDFDDGASMASVDTIVQGAASGSRLGNGPMGVDEVESAEVARRLSNHEEDSLDDAETLQRLKNHIGPRAPPDGVPVPFGKEDSVDRKNEELSRRLEAIESQLERALELGKTLAGQHAEATEAVKRLEEKVKTLEGGQVSQPILAREESKHHDLTGAMEAGGAAAIASGSIPGIIEAKWGKWRDAFESEYQRERSSFQAEREEVKRVVKMWDNLNTEVEDVLEGIPAEESISEATLSDTASKEVSPSTPNNASAAKKRRRRRAAAAAAATSNQRPSTGSVGLASSSSHPSTSTIDYNIARINRELRSLLYTDDFNDLVRESHQLSTPEDGSSLTAADREETPTQSDIGINTDEVDITKDKQSRKQTILPSSSSSLQKRRGGGGSSSQGLDGPAAALPVLGFAGVVVFGMTAWVLSGGKGLHLSGSPGGY